MSQNEPEPEDNIAHSQFETVSMEDRIGDQMDFDSTFIAQNRHAESYFDQTAPEDDQQFGGVSEHSENILVDDDSWQRGGDATKSFDDGSNNPFSSDIK